MHIDYNHESPEHLMILLKRRRATVLAGTVASLIAALVIGVAMVTLMYR